jgi:hypothetical protein
MTYRADRPRVSAITHLFSIHDDEIWLQVRLANAGKGEIDLDGATCDLMGPTVTVLPYRLKSAASHVLLFRAPLTQIFSRIGSVTLNVGLGDGRSLVSQVQLTDQEQAAFRLAFEEIEFRSRIVHLEEHAGNRYWIPPTQDEV